LSSKVRRPPDDGGSLLCVRFQLLGWPRCAETSATLSKRFGLDFSITLVLQKRFEAHAIVFHPDLS
jgi:hypothetical protein